MYVGTLSTDVKLEAGWYFTSYLSLLLLLYANINPFLSDC